MNLHKLICIILIMSMVMTCIAVVGMPVASATTADPAVEYSENFDSYSEMSEATAQPSLAEKGWYICNRTRLITDTSDSAYGYPVASIMTGSGSNTSNCLRIIGGGTSKSGQNYYFYGYGRSFPGVDPNAAASGSWNISFDFKPVLVSNQAQFAFSLVQATGSGDSAANNILACQGQDFYIGYHDFNTLRGDGSPSSGITQGKLPATKIGSAVWYTVKVNVNCDEKYYSVELREYSASGEGALIARRSPISFGGETVSFLKFSAYNLDRASAVFVDNVSITQAERDKTIYNETFESFSTAAPTAAAGMTTGDGVEDYDGDSYFEGYTPWRYNSSVGDVGNVGNAYALGTVSGSQVVRLGNQGGGIGGASGLVYMQALEDLVTQTTQASRGLLKTSFKIMPNNIANNAVVTVNAISDASTQDISDNAYAVFKISKKNNTVLLDKGNGESQELSHSTWYQAELYFDVVNRKVTTKIKENKGGTITFVQSGNTMPDGVKAIMFNVPSTAQVHMDDIKLEYCDAADVPTVAPVVTPTPEVTAAPVAPVVDMGDAHGAYNNTNAFYYVITIDLNDGDATDFTVEYYPTNKSEAQHEVQSFNLEKILHTSVKLISVLKEIPADQRDCDITGKATLSYTIGEAGGTVVKTATTTLNGAMGQE